MGLFTGLLTLPLAPIRGTVWIAEQLVAEAERELRGEQSGRRRLLVAERQLELGLLTQEEYEVIEEAALDQLEAEQEEREGLT
jgi:Gas vesicle protein G